MGSSNALHARRHRVNLWIQASADRCSPLDSNPGLPDSLLRRRAPSANGPPVLLQDLPPKTAHQILRSVTWTEVGSAQRTSTALRDSIGRAARWVRSFPIYVVIFTDILRRLSK